VHHSDWHLNNEVDFDALTRRRMTMPWERVENAYRFEGPNGALSLADLFDGRSQLEWVRRHDQY
jgi:predicted dithiol-disulfide oxidoreductase (DUF899 family)